MYIVFRRRHLPIYFKPSVLYENTSSSQQIDYEVIAYPIYVGLQHLDWTITKRYDDSGGTFFETAELYTYDDRERLFNVRENGYIPARETVSHRGIIIHRIIMLDIHSL